MAYRIIELSKLLKAKECKLQEQKTRLASLSGRISELEAEHQQLKGRVEDLGSGNCARKVEYDALHERYRLREEELRRAAEKEQQLIESLVRKKVEAAKHQNKKNERVKQARLSRELKKATKRTVSIDLGLTRGWGFHRQKQGPRLPESFPLNGSGVLSWLGQANPPRSAGARDGTGAVTAKQGHAEALGVAPVLLSLLQEAHFSEVNAVKFSPSSGMLATGGADSLIRLWSVAGGRLESLQTLEGANGSITSIEFDPSVSEVLLAGPVLWASVHRGQLLRWCKLQALR
uniref:Autophagy related 16 like 2 n=1 Tax=Chelonoidis abingdonii TaxID=106734 RepID=A0A8C0IZJ6_CHEAB